VWNEGAVGIGGCRMEGLVGLEGFPESATAAKHCQLYGLPLPVALGSVMHEVYSSK